MIAAGVPFPLRQAVAVLDATDGLGDKHYAVGASYWATHDHEGFGDRWLWSRRLPRPRPRK